jgi:hypothetical protein
MSGGEEKGVIGREKGKNAVGHWEYRTSISSFSILNSAFIHCYDNLLFT